MGCGTTEAASIEIQALLGLARLLARQTAREFLAASAGTGADPTSRETDGPAAADVARAGTSGGEEAAS